MLDYPSFKKLFGRNFWKSFKRVQIPLPKSSSDKDDLLQSVYSSIQSRTYSPSNPEFYMSYNKGFGVARITPVFCIQDYIVYYYCIIRLEFKLAQNRTENTFGGWSISGLEYRSAEESEINGKLQSLYDPSVSMPSWSFSPKAWYAAYRDYNAKLYCSLQQSTSGYVVELDIANYYDSINLNILQRKIGEIFNVDYRDEISLLFHFLKHWNKSIHHYNPQTVGLPQDAMSDCSRILANFYLQEYDRYMKEICDGCNAQYFRYADDQVILVQDKQDIEHIVYSASRKLLALGLSINQKKVQVKTLDQAIEYRSYRIFDLLLKPDSANDPDRSLEFIKEVIKVIESDKKESIKSKGVPLLNRALSCNWDKVTHSDQFKMFAWYLDDSYLLNAKYYRFKSIYKKLHTDTGRKDFIKQLLQLSDNSIYSGYHYELIAFLTEIKVDIKPVVKRLKDLSNIY
jgi:hypothetical protein